MPVSTIGRRGAGRRFPRDVGLDADGEARAQRDARAARRRSASLRLRRGDAAAAPAQRRRPRRARGDLPHALPRRPLPRASGHAQDVRAPRPRGSAHDLRPERARRSSSGRSGASSDGCTYPVSTVVLEPGARLERDGYVDRAVRGRASASRRSATRSSRTSGPGRFDVDEATRLGVPDGRERGLLQRGESVTLADGRVVAPSDVLGEARAGRKVVLAGDTAPAASVVEAAAGADLLVHEATFLADERERARETGALDRRRGGARRARGRREAPRAHARVDALLRSPGRRGGDAALPGDGRAARLRPRDDPVSRARRAGARALGRANALRPCERTRSSSSRRARRSRARRRSVPCRPRSPAREPRPSRRLPAGSRARRAALPRDEIRVGRPCLPRSVSWSSPGPQPKTSMRAASLAVQVAVRPEPADPPRDAERRLDPPERHARLLERGGQRRDLLADDRGARRRGDGCAVRARSPDRVSRACRPARARDDLLRNDAGRLGPAKR